MKEFADKVAVITGAASGIGKAVAERCVHEGMKVVLVDVEEAALEQTVKEFRAIGADALLSVKTDVSKLAQIEAVATQTMQHYGAVHFVFNNAGVGGGGGLIWERSIADWDWVMGVNLWGVVYGIKTFVPLMLKGGEEGHVVNTASMAGLGTATLGIYSVTKHAVVALSESLYLGLKRVEAKVSTSVLCPGWVNTRIVESERNRPEEFVNHEALREPTPEEMAAAEMVRQAIATGMPPSQIADKVFEAIINDTFYILPHQEMKPFIETRMERIMAEQNPEGFILEVR